MSIVPHILFRPEAGSGVGLGHLQRCLSLGMALEVLGVKNTFISSGEQQVHDWIAGAGFTAVPQPSPSPEFIADLAFSLGCTAIVVDSYEVGHEYITTLRETGLFVVVIDDFGIPPFHGHITVNGGVAAQDLPYDQGSSNSRFLLGPAYSLLSPSYVQKSRAPRSAVQRVLITMGGADDSNLTPGIIDALGSVAAPFAIDVVVGPFNLHQKEIAAAAARSRQEVALFHSPATLRDLIQEADLAVSAGGQTLNEFAVTGTPAVVVKVAENQSPNIDAFASSGCIIPISSSESANQHSEIVIAITTLIADGAKRTSMSQAGRRLIDGKGAMRVAKVIAAQHRSHWTM